jgi:hypothetical protein
MNQTTVYDLLKQIKDRADMPIFLRRAGLTHRICELGVESGINFHNLLRCQPEEAIGVDLWGDMMLRTITDCQSHARMLEHYENAKRVIANKPNARYFKAHTAQAVRAFRDEYFDFIYLDADHSYESTKRDMALWWPKLKKGGVFGGHDYFRHTSSYQFGVVEAVDEFVAERHLVYFYHTPEPFAPSWFILKPPNLTVEVGEDVEIPNEPPPAPPPVIVVPPERPFWIINGQKVYQ